MLSRYALMPGAIRNAKVVLGGLALWLVFHPYLGIWHDARLYSVAALRWLTPEAYARDVWFSFGSQDDLTLFSPLYALFIQMLGLDAAARTLVLLCALGWVIAVWVLSRALLPWRMAVAACLTLCMLPLWYSLSGIDIFQVSESFVTARMTAVPLSLFGVVMVHRARLLAGAVLLLCAAVLHPIMASGPIALAICLCCTERLQFRLLVAALLAFALAMANPMDWAPLRPIDGEWMALIRSSGSSALLQAGNLKLARILACLALLLWAAALASGPSARLYRTLAFVVAWSLLAAVVVSFFYPSALLVQIQPWRSLWFAVVIVVPAGFQIAAVAWQGGAAARWLLVLGGAALIGGGVWGALGVLALRALHATLPPATLARLAALDHREKRMLALIGGALMLLAAPTLYLELVGAGISARGSALENDGQYLCRAIGLYFLFPLLVWWVSSREGARQNWAGLVCAAVLVAGAIGFWDIRSNSRQLQEARYHGGTQPVLFGGKVQRGETVYWPGNTLRVWFELGTASYVGEEQAVGIVFSEPRTLELWRRMERIGQSPETTDQAAKGPMPNLHRIDSSTPLTMPGLRRLCADPVLDHVIDSMRLEGYFVAREDSPEAGGARVFYLYDCREIRRLKTPRF